MKNALTTLLVILLLSACVRNRSAQIASTEGTDFPDIPEIFVPPVTQQPDEDIVDIVEDAPAIACAISVSPPMPEVGDSFVISVLGSGPVTRGQINTAPEFNGPVGLLPSTATNAGTFPILAVVFDQAGNSSSCVGSVTITSAPPPPACTLSKLSLLTERGGSILYRINSQGGYPYVNGVAPDADGVVQVSQSNDGKYYANGEVRGPGNEVLATCEKVFTPANCQLELVDNLSSAVKVKASQYGNASAISVDGDVYSTSASSITINLGERPSGAATSNAEFISSTGDLGYCKLSYSVREPVSIYSVKNTNICGGDGSSYETQNPPEEATCTHTRVHTQANLVNDNCETTNVRPNFKGGSTRTYTCQKYKITFLRYE